MQVMQISHHLCTLIHRLLETSITQSCSASPGGFPRKGQEGRTPRPPPDSYIVRHLARVPLFRLGEPRPAQVISNESKNLLAMFLRDGEFYIVSVSHFIAKKA